MIFIPCPAIVHVEAYLRSCGKAKKKNIYLGSHYNFSMYHYKYYNRTIVGVMKGKNCRKRFFCHHAY